MTDENAHRPVKQGYCKQLLETIIADGKPVPALMIDALYGDIRPLAATTYETVGRFAQENGYSDENTATLRAAIAVLTRSTGYLRAVAEEGASRHNVVNGARGAAVSSEDRMTAQMALLTTALGNANTQLGIAIEKLSAVAKHAAEPKAAKPGHAAIEDIRNQIERTGVVIGRVTLTIPGLMTRHRPAGDRKAERRKGSA